MWEEVLDRGGWWCLTSECCKCDIYNAITHIGDVSLTFMVRFCRVIHHFEVSGNQEVAIRRGLLILKLCTCTVCLHACIFCTFNMM